MGIVDVLNVTVVSDPSTAVDDFSVTAPASGTSADIHALTLEGWIVPRDGAVEGLDVVVAGHGPMWRLGFNLLNPDVLDVSKGPPPANACGFRHMINATRLPREFRVRLVVRLAGGERVHLATIEGRRQPLRADVVSRFRPLMLTTLGRTGGTWATLLLDQHPEIIGFRSFDYEPRAGVYWGDVFHALAEPASYFQTLRADMRGLRWWMGDNLVPPPRRPPDPQFEQWLGREWVEELVGVVKQRIDSFYVKTAESEGKPRAAFFTEKYAPESSIQQLFWEVYPGAREIFLVRDFRDMAASQLAYAKKRGYRLFGRDLVQSDEDHILGLRRSAKFTLKTWSDRSSDAYLLKYEDLVRRPSETLAQLMAYIGLDADPSLVDAMIRNAASVRANEQADHRTAESPAQSIGRWEELAPSLREACDEAFADVLTEFGY